MGVNFTTTKVPLWQIECDNFRRVGSEYELRDLATPEHDQFVQNFAARYDLDFKRDGSTVTFAATHRVERVKLS